MFKHWKKESGVRSQESGEERRKKEEGRRKKEEGRRKKEEEGNYPITNHPLPINYPLPIT
ncbi:hypothetical protein [Dolichospermum sp. UHCC 0259]|uniref:hypothetical protein n=1 Tax=Dolichospermum sp. UHCC 0259 TaxID=2590010 RepID=UPI001446CDA5|nr:hypothetical protein [Dolichospermum sp. UHCC 0259]